MKIEEELEALRDVSKRIKQGIKQEFIKKHSELSYLINFERRKYIEAIIEDEMKKFKFIAKDRNIEICSILKYWEALFR